MTDLLDRLAANKVYHQKDGWITDPICAEAATAIRDAQARIAELETTIKQAVMTVNERNAEIEKLRFQLIEWRRAQINEQDNTAYWLTFTDGTSGCCEGPSAYDAVQIAQKVTGKTVADAPGNGWGLRYHIEELPYPARPLIWQFDHPLHGKTPAICYRPEQCKGRSSCPQSPACSE